MFTIIQAKPQYLAEIYTMILELAQYEGIYDRIRITESQLANLLFCDKPNHFVAIALVDEKLVGLAMYTQNPWKCDLTNSRRCEPKVKQSSGLAMLMHGLVLLNRQGRWIASPLRDSQRR